MSDKVDITQRLQQQVSWLKRENLPGSADMCIEAANEIERLRMVVDEYREAFEFERKEFHEALDDLAKMKTERDEARRMVCEWHGGLRVQHPQDYAKRRGWDCFKEDGK